MQRRAFLNGAGIVTILVVGGSVWRAEDQGVFSVGQGLAYQPWKDWQKDTNDGPLTLVRAAILAASPHNTQPWLFKVTNSRIELYVDTQRNTGALDPFKREQHIGLGCALENLMLAAAANGYNASATLLPGEPEAKLVASVELAPGAADRSELYDAIPRRHTNRNPCDPKRAVPPEFTEALIRLTSNDPEVKLFLFAEYAERKKIAEMISTADKDLYSDSQVEHGSDGWIRTKWRSVQKYRDGLTIDAFGLPVTTAAVAKFIPMSMLRRIMADRQLPYLRLLLSAPMYGLIAVRDRYSREQSLRGGRIWQRAHLLATARGLAARPVNEAVEMVDHERKLGLAPRHAGLLTELTGNAEWQPTFAFYMGYATRQALASPRRPVQDVVL